MKDFREAFGLLFYAAQVLRAPVWKWYYPIKLYSRRLSSNWPDSSAARVWPCCLPQLNDWFDFLLCNEPVTPPQPGLVPSLTIFTDSSDHGWGVVIIDETTGRIIIRGGKFQNSDHINIKEAVAWRFSIDIVRELFSPFPSVISWYIDNTSALGAIRKGRSPAFALNKVIAEARNSIPSTTTFTISYIPSHLNLQTSPVDIPLVR